MQSLLDKSPLAFGIVPILFLSACASTDAREPQPLFEPLSADTRVALMPPDIRYYLITAGGTPELHDEWTADAERHFVSASMRFAQESGIKLSVVGRADLDAGLLRYEGLHAAVGEAIIDHSDAATRLPTRAPGDISGWTLGPGIHDLRRVTDADYALFIHYRENQPSGGRLAFAILAAAAKTVIPTGSEHGFASMVDLDTGAIVWFGTIYDGGFELREPAGASRVAGWLIESLPVGDGLARGP